MEANKAGEAYESDTRLGLLAHAKLGIGEEASGKLVTVVRELAIDMAKKTKADLILIDGPPGTGCSVISTLAGVDLALVVTEPTISGVHDLERVLEVAGHFNTPALVCINKCDINREKTGDIRAICNSCKARVIGELPFDNTPTEAIISGKAVVEYVSNTFSANIEEMWNEVKEVLEL
jgi:MinD superfamily P-loop ATPase